MKKTLQLALLAIAAALSLSSCDMNFYGGTPTAYGQLDNYYVINDYYNQYYYDNNASKLIITDAYEFQRVFGQAATMGGYSNYGVPTNVNFNHEFVIAVILPVTNRYTEIEPVSVNRQGNKLYFTYKVYRGSTQSYYVQPFTAVVVDKRDLCDIVFQQVTSHESIYRGSDQRYLSSGVYNYSSGYYNGGYYYNTYRYKSPTPPPPGNWRDYSRTYRTGDYVNYQNNNYYINNYNTTTTNHNNNSSSGTVQGRRPTTNAGNNSSVTGNSNNNSSNNRTGNTGNRPAVNNSNNNNNSSNANRNATTTSGRRPTPTTTTGNNSSSTSNNGSNTRPVQAAPSTSSSSSSNTNNSSSSSSSSSSSGTNSHRR